MPCDGARAIGALRGATGALPQRQLCVAARRLSRERGEGRVGTGSASAKTMMNPTRASLHVLAALFFVACVSEPKPVATALPGPSASVAVPGSECALGVRGAKVSMEKVARGVILTFVIAGDGSVDDLRMRVEHIAKQHGPGAHLGPGHDGQHGSGDGHGIHLSDLPPVETSFQSIEGGARLQILATESSDVSEVQERMRAPLQRVATSQCH